MIETLPDVILTSSEGGLVVLCIFLCFQDKPPTECINHILCDTVCMAKHKMSFKDF
jgi:hypothetical protein